MSIDNRGIEKIALEERKSFWRRLEPEAILGILFSINIRSLRDYS